MKPLHFIEPEGLIFENNLFKGFCLIKMKHNSFFLLFLCFVKRSSSLFFFLNKYSHKFLERSLTSSHILAPIGILNFMQIYFLPGHKEMEGLRTLRNLSETTAPWRSVQSRGLRDQKVEGGEGRGGAKT